MSNKTGGVGRRAELRYQIPNTKYKQRAVATVNIPNLQYGFSYMLEQPKRERGNLTSDKL